MEVRTDIPMIDQVKIQAEVLVPVIRALRGRLGRESADALISEALAGVSRERARVFSQMLDGSPIDKVEAALPLFSAGGALEVEPRERGDDEIAFDVTRCRYAEFFREHGLKEFGFLISCARDRAAAEGLSPDLEFERTTTIMQGADRCDFRYRLKKKR
ncbi:MAG: 2-amino-thiazoline-4-carboxylic acid hydrolase [Deltaproteobacteria bacterium]|nr:MAG: 2-amino-thiazoline-4-carboxylic acid hydrolase [Deltaproteobacteria bacterium]